MLKFKIRMAKFSHSRLFAANKFCNLSVFDVFDHSQGRRDNCLHYNGYIRTKISVPDITIEFKMQDLH